jgi:hypothetical protein
MNAPAFAPAKFERGRLMMTRGIAALVNENPAAFATVNCCIRRHLSGDCGEMSEDDVLANLRAMLHGGERIFSGYDTQLGRIWIITEADRSATTVLLPEEY